jgi:hypothetical protein
MTKMHMNCLKKYRSEDFEAIHETLEDAYRRASIEKHLMINLDEKCLTEHYIETSQYKKLVKERDKERVKYLLKIVEEPVLDYENLDSHRGKQDEYGSLDIDSCFLWDKDDNVLIRN